MLLSEMRQNTYKMYMKDLRHDLWGIYRIIAVWLERFCTYSGQSDPSSAGRKFVVEMIWSLRASSDIIG